VSIKSIEKLISLEKEARGFGFDWPDHNMVIDQAISESEEVRDAINSGESKERIKEEVGDLIHTAISVCMFLGFTVEETTDIVADKFAKRFGHVKNIANEQGFENLKGQTTEKLVEIWNEAKRRSE
jgi:uncharacterized protein YabN with tetrapyrrole methylase and pyrophosphatase domain